MHTRVRKTDTPPSQARFQNNTNENTFLRIRKRIRCRRIQVGRANKGNGGVRIRTTRESYASSVVELVFTIIYPLFYYIPIIIIIIRILGNGKRRPVKFITDIGNDAKNDADNGSGHCFVKCSFPSSAARLATDTLNWSTGSDRLSVVIIQYKDVQSKANRTWKLVSSDCRHLLSVVYRQTIKIYWLINVSRSDQMHSRDIIDTTNGSPPRPSTVAEWSERMFWMREVTGCRLGRNIYFLYILIYINVSLVQPSLFNLFH